MGLANFLPNDTQIVEEIDSATGAKSYYLVYSLSKDLIPEGLTYRYKFNNLKEVSEAVGPTAEINATITKDGDDFTFTSGSLQNITIDDYANSFYFGNHTQLRSVYTQLDLADPEEGAQSYDYLIESLNIESQYKPYLMSKDAKGRYDYLAVVIEAALEGRTAREAELAQTTWWKKHTASERQEMLFAHQDPATFSKRGIRTREDIISKMMAAGITELDGGVIDAITQKAQYGVFDDNDIQNTINKLANPLIRYTLDPEIKAALEGKTLETIELTRQIENTINSILGPGVADNYNLEQLLADYQDNPTAFTQEFLPNLEDQFQAKFTQYEGTNVKSYESIAPLLRQEWQSITGQRADETTAAWNQFIATNDVAERRDIAFAAAAESGSQAYRDQFKQDMESAFGKAGARSTGGGRFGL